MSELAADDMRILVAHVAEPLVKVALTLEGVCRSSIERADPGTSADMTSADRPGFEHDQEMHDALVHIGQALDILAAFVPPDGPLFRAYSAADRGTPLAAVRAVRSDSTANVGALSVVITTLVEAIRANAIAAHLSAKDANPANAETAAEFATAAKELAQAANALGIKPDIPA